LRGVLVSAAELVPVLRDLYLSLPETYHLQPWELQHVLFRLGYTDDLADEAKIASAVEVAQGDSPQWRAA
jgi:hypothetical protein